VSGGLIVAAPKSGSGKTLIVAGLLRHLRHLGIRVAAAKCGPDYIDPTFHALAAGAPCLNLDPWAMRPATLSALLGDRQASSKLVLCEGVMGLFDGAGPDGAAGSTAALARLAGWPVILVVDAAGQGHSVAALVAGFARHDRDVPLAGVILNRVAGDRHEAMLRAAITRHLGDLPVLGALPHDDDLRVESRHLGLVPAGERNHVDALLERAAARIGERLEIDGLIALARPSPGSGAPPAIPLPPLGPHIAVARDDAFLFTYEATLAGWRRQGAAVSFFSPLADEAPAPEADAIYLPGGYPELHAGRLAAATRLRNGLREAADAGKTVYGECGGYMVLGETLTAGDGAIHRMAGLLPLRTSFAARRRHLGYRAVQLCGACRLGDAGARFRGHEFHYATIIEERGAEPLFRVSDASACDLGHAGLRRGTVYGSFIHLIDRADDRA
jgi:cobyrinic acid a,c-diamide synthase